MPYPFGPRKRINYRYLTHLAERLTKLGHDIHEIPHETLTEFNWNVIRDYITTELGLPYCVRCKLPCAAEEMAPDMTNICSEHATTFRTSIEARQQRCFERKLARMGSQTAQIAAMQRRRDKQIVAATKVSRIMHPEVKSLDMDAFLNKANKRDK